ncbi:MAG: ATP-binding protein [Reichenbachiella sp.]|uniref:AlbA family DNA-binding domain-containing protein n=1 Tax=Reichenbachiella sp. TaxID=2184521 RepID=UPI0032980FEA
MIEILNKESISEEDIQSLISSETEESISLDFKSAGSLDKADKKKNEIAKDVSAFANSAGGYIVYGIAEEDHKANSISPIDGTVFTKEWLEQIIQTRIQRKIEGLLIIPVRIKQDIKQSVYVVKIPESPHAPHMTSDKKFYKRFNFESVQMEEYEIRNLYNRKDKTKLEIHNIISTKGIKYEDEVDGEMAYLDLSFQIENIGKAVEKDYKLLIKLNFRNYSFKWDPVINTKNFNHSMINDDQRMISFFGVSPIFPDEILTIGNVKFGLLNSEIKDTLKTAEFQMILMYSNGTDEMIINLSDLFKPTHN